MRRVDIKVTFKCNNHFKFCVQGNKREVFSSKPYKELIKELEEGIVECCDEGCWKEYPKHFGWGEFIPI